MFDETQLAWLRRNCKGFVVMAVGIVAFVILGVAVLALSGCGDPYASNMNEKANAAKPYSGEIKRTYNVGGDDDTTRFYDSELKVWCWKTGHNQGGIACIPEWQLEDQYSRVDPNEDPINGGE
jgi:hypothetical protein